MSVPPGSVGTNPYVGPRPLRIGEAIFGREREITELDHLLSAERIVLLYSPSGAGKSSLVNAGLIPRLDWYYALSRGLPIEGRFDVWAPTRVNLPVPEGLGVRNRFGWSAAVGLEQEVPEAFRRPPEMLASLSLKEAAAGRRRRNGAPDARLLIFDQFEEVLRVDPLAVTQKDAFFDDLGELLHDPLIWALFCLREDYLAALDPYCRRLPTHLKNRYRIDRLTLEAAALAVESPALQTPRRFAPGVVNRLVTDLAQVRVQQPDGSFQQQTGLHVEPIHLQVVCVGLWDRMAPDDLTIDEGDLATFGDVGDALKGYYETAVGNVSAGSAGRERAIRDWFEERLITPDGVRRQVLRGVDQSEGLPNGEIAALLDTYLVRAEPRAGATWYELAHDRLIRPVRESNAAWRTAHLSELQRTAELWERGGRPDGMLLRGEALDAAVVWAREHSSELTETERELVDKSASARTAELKARRQAKRMTFLALAMSVFFVLACGAFFYAEHQRQIAEDALQDAERQRKDALAQKHEAQRQTERAQRGLFNAQLARGREVLQRNPAGARWWLEDEGRFPKDLRDPAWDALHALAPLSSSVRGGEVPRAHSGGIYGIALTPDRQTLASAGRDGSVVLWDLKTLTHRGRIPGSGKQVTAVAFVQDGKVLCAATADGRLEHWDLPTGKLLRSLPLLEPESEAGVVGQTTAGLNDIKVHPDGRLIAAAGGDGKVLLTAANEGAETIPLLGHESPVSALAISPNGEVLASADQTGAVLLWDLANRTLGTRFQGPAEGIRALAFAPDGNRLAAAGADGSVRLWQAGGVREPLILRGHRREVTAVLFDGDGDILVSADAQGAVILWDSASGETRASLSGHTGTILGLGFLADGRTLVTASADDSLRLWELEEREAKSATITGHSGPVYGLAFAPGGERIASASWDGSVRLWDPHTGVPLGEALGGDLKAAYNVAFTPDGRTVAAGGLDGIIRLYDPEQRAEPRRLAAEPPVAVVRLAIGGHGPILAAAGADSRVRIWDLGTDDPTPRVLQGHGERVTGVAFAPDGAVLATVSWDGTLRLWDAQGGGALRTLEPGAGRLEGVAFSPDGGQVAAGSWQGSILRWDPKTGAELKTLSGHSDRVVAIAYAPDGATLASASEDGTARLWDLASDRPPRTLAEHTDWVADIAFSPNGEVLATASWDRTLKLWRVRDDRAYRFSLPGEWFPPARRLAATAPPGEGVLGPDTGAGAALTARQLVDAGVSPERAELWIDRLNAAMERFQIDTPLRRAHFLAQVLYESAYLKLGVENLNYSADRLTRVFPKYFPSPAIAESYAGKPERIANRVYANRLGNGDEASGDGWRYRGRGVIWFTGKHNYRKLGEALGVDLVENPDALTAEYAADAAGYLWDSSKLNALADKDDLSGITRRIRGGLVGQADRLALVTKLKRILGAY